MPILTWSYWFDLQARELMPAVKLGLLAAFAALFLLGIVAGVLAKRKSDHLAWAEGGRRFSSLALWMGVLGLLLVLFTHELVYFFGARFWYLVWLLAFLVLLVRWLKFQLVDVQERKVAYDAQARIDKWIPHHKK
jgi:hypothetical protein